MLGIHRNPSPLVGLETDGLPWTALLRDFAGTAAWTGRASAGSSGDGSHDFGGGSTPGFGSALGGRPTAAFDGASAYLVAEGDLGSYVSAGAFTGYVVIVPTSVAASRVIMSDSAGAFAIYLDGAGTASIIVNATSAAAQATRAITAAAHIVMFRSTGTLLQIGVDEVPGAAAGWSSVAFSAGLDSVAGILELGRDALFPSFYSGDIAGLGLTDVALTDDQLTERLARLQRYWGLS